MSDPARLGGSLLPRVRHLSNQDHWWMSHVMHKFAVGFQDSAVQSDACAVLKGGFGSFVSCGLNRPAVNFTFDWFGKPPNVSMLANHATRSIGEGMETDIVPLWRRVESMYSIDMKHPVHGSREFPLSIRQVGTDVSEADALGPASTWGVLTYPPAMLAQQLIDGVLNQGRLFARDRYDLTWWLLHHIEFVTPQQRLKLANAVLHSSRLQDTWDAGHYTDPVMEGVDSKAMRSALSTVLTADPVTLRHTHPQGSVAASFDKRGGCILNFRTAEAADVQLGSFQSLQCAADFLADAAWMRREDVPAFLQQALLSSAEPSETGQTPD